MQCCNDLQIVSLFYLISNFFGRKFPFKCMVFFENVNDMYAVLAVFIIPVEVIKKCYTNLVWPKFNVTSSPIKTNGAQYIASLKSSDSRISFMAWLRELLALFPSNRCR